MSLNLSQGDANAISIFFRSNKVNKKKKEEWLNNPNNGMTEEGKRICRYIMDRNFPLNDIEKRAADKLIGYLEGFKDKKIE